MPHRLFRLDSERRTRWVPIKAGSRDGTHKCFGSPERRCQAAVSSRSSDNRRLLLCRSTWTTSMSQARNQPSEFIVRPNRLRDAATKIRKDHETPSAYLGITGNWSCRRGRTAERKILQGIFFSRPVQGPRDRRRGDRPQRHGLGPRGNIPDGQFIHEGASQRRTGPPRSSQRILDGQFRCDKRRFQTLHRSHAVRHNI